MSSPTHSDISQNNAKILEKQWQNYIRLSTQLRRQGGKQKKRPGRKLRGRGLQRRRREKGEWWSIFNSFKMRC